VTAAALPNARLVAAEILKLRKRRGLMIAASLLTIGIVLVVNVVLVILHAVNPDHHGPAGGTENLGGATNAIAFLGAAVGVLLGATAGTGDVSAGVFRELVVTGRSRISLFLARIPGGLAVLYTLVLVCFAISAGVAVSFADSLPTPGGGLLVQTALWLFLQTGFYFLIALGAASLIGSRATTIAILLAFHLAAEPLLLSIGFLGASRKALPAPALERFTPAGIAEAVDEVSSVHVSLTVAILVLAVWLGATLGAGAWRTRSRDA
jgi:hypothetical protein